MITNFEEITHELTDKEKSILNIVVNVFLKINNPIKSHEVCSMINQEQSIFKVTDVRLRKFVNHIRKNNIIPIIATSNGYFVSFDKNVIQKQIISLYERANSIKDTAIGLEYFLRDVNNQYELF